MSIFSFNSGLIIKDKKLSLKAKGLYLYLKDKDSEWQFSEKKIANENKDGVIGVKGACDELTQAGYLKIEDNSVFLFDKGTKIKKFDYNKITTSNSLNMDINYLIEPFANMDKLNGKKLYGNPFQRKACENMIEVYGLDKCVQLAVKIIENRMEPFCPVVFTPCQLRDKWEKVERFLNNLNRNSNYQINNFRVMEGI